MVELKSKLKGKVLILGMGNSLKGDDGVGPHFVRKFRIPNSEFRILDTGTAPENYTGKIKQIKPDTLLIVDAIDFGGQPGTVKVFDEDKIEVQGFSTHNVSLKTFIKFLKADLPSMQVLVVGIQPKGVGLGEGLSPEVEEAVNKLCMSLG